MMVNYPFGIGMAHNGNIVNYYDLKKNLKENNNRHLFTQNDLEALLNILAEGLVGAAAKNNNQSEKFEFAHFE